MSRARAKVEQLYRDLSKSKRVRAPITEQERVDRWFAEHPNGAAGARDRLAERIARLLEGADGGDEAAAAQLDRVRVSCTDLVNRQA
jgi:hypothetical protein